MTLALTCLLVAALWAILLVLSLGIGRLRLLARGEQRADGFVHGADAGHPALTRLNRAHGNAVENLPIFGAVVVVGTFAGVDAPLFGQLALVTLCARVGQSLVLVASAGPRASVLRFTAFAVQVLSLLGMVVLVLRYGR